MHEFGISVFPDLTDKTKTEEYICKAAESGFTKMFTSMILADQHFDGAANPDDPIFWQTIAFAAKKDLKVYCDFNDNVIAYFGSLDNTLNYLHDAGVYGIRIDGGLKADELAYITKHPSDLILQINASDIRIDLPAYKNKYLEAIKTINENGDLRKVEACFNYYPRQDTGISIKTIEETCSFLKEYGIKVSAFISSTKAYSFLHKESHGVMSVESLRYIRPYVASKILLCSGIEDIFFGDTLVPDDELNELRDSCINEPVQILFRYRHNVPVSLKEILRKEIIQYNRFDEPDYLIRCCKYRGIKSKPFNIEKRPFGSVTIDNELSAQYEGEIQIILKDLDSFNCANVIGDVDDDYRLLLKYIKKGNIPFVLKGVE
ncbi:MAG: DUF871 family protein [Erysipelotrichaceae bacterium]|nr:DUF871 family protein [Erysipelotrichaceae bacterium]